MTALTSTLVGVIVYNNMRLKLLREKKGMTVRALASKSKMTAAHISRVENGKADPSLSVLKRLAGALGVTVSELLRDEHALSPSLRRRSST
jgi:transcriptional regulator with XRE-family HTH domain